MFLKSGNSKSIMKYNVIQLVNEGYSQEQATRIALKEMKRGKKHRRRLTRKKKRLNVKEEK